MAKLFTIVVGCNYVDSPLKLPRLTGAEADAQHMAGFLEHHPVAGGSVEQVVLLGRQATAEGVSQALRPAVQAQTDPADSVLLYFAGHGGYEADTLIIYGWDACCVVQDWIEEFGYTGRPIRMVLDCCHAGGSGTGITAVPPGFDDASADTPEEADPSATPRRPAVIPVGNIQILCATRVDELATEVQHSGVFTTALLTVLDRAGAPPLLRLPLGLHAWRDAVQAELLARAALPAADATRGSAHLAGSSALPQLAQNVTLIEGRIPDAQK